MSKSKFASLIGAAVAVATPVSAGAQQAKWSDSDSLRRWSKTETILGGAPSALEALLARQESSSYANGFAVRPAAYSRLRHDPSAINRKRFDYLAWMSGRPDVFGSVALPVRRTRLDARWRKVERARIGGLTARFAESLRNSADINRLEAVNRYVNSRVRYVEDRQQHGLADVWSAATQTLGRGRGDCEDYAIAKLQMLRHAGISDSDLYLVIVKDLTSRRDHAVLVVRAAQRMFVLDNGTDRLFESESVRDYRPVMTFAASGTWTHGYRIGPPAYHLASAQTPKGPPVPASGA